MTDQTPTVTVADITAAMSAAKKMQRAMQSLNEAVTNTKADLHRRLMTLAGIPVIVSPVMPTRPPTPGEWARRYVRHGMADELAWLGEDVGPEPDEPITLADAYVVSSPAASFAQRYVVMHPRAYAKIKDLTA